MNALTFKLTLQQPLLVGQVGAGEENSSVSVDYIAGSTLRGALIGRYLQAYGDFDFDTLPADAPVRRLFFSSEVTFLNAYLQDDQGQRSLPTPQSWKVEKDETDIDHATVVDAAIGDLGTLDDPKSLKQRPYCAIDGEILTLYKPKRQSGLHNASIERYVKREGDSFVFRYDALAPGQIFCGVILSTDTTLLGQIEGLLEEPDLFLGGSRSAGYGHTVLSAIEQVPDWQEYIVPTVDDPPDEEITLTLLSDAILRDAYGQFTTDLLALPTIQALQVEPTAGFVSTGLTGGFNRKWGLPMPQAPVLKAGSVWTFPATAETALQTLVENGIGERRGEGFGRVAVNWQQHKVLGTQKPMRASQPRRTDALNGTSQTLAARMVERLYRQQLEQMLLNALFHKQLAIGGVVPENSQLSRLRLVVRQAWLERNATLLLQFLDKLKPLARNQYLQAQIERKSLLEWLKAEWQNDNLWNAHFVDVQTTLPRIGNIQATATPALKLEYCARLVDALCTKAIRERQAEQQKGDPTKEATI